MNEDPKTFTFNHDPAKVAALPKFRPAPDASPVTPEEKAAVRAGRRKKWDGLGVAGVDEIAGQEAPPAAPRENVESVEVAVPNGMVVVYGPRPGSNLSWDIAEMLGDAVRNNLKVALAKVALCVRSIDGREIKKPGNEIEARKIANVLGEDGIDMLYLVHDEVWPPVRKENLPTIRKIFREF